MIDYYVHADVASYCFSSELAQMSSLSMDWEHVETMVIDSCLYLYLNIIRL